MCLGVSGIRQPVVPPSVTGATGPGANQPPVNTGVGAPRNPAIAGAGALPAKNAAAANVAQRQPQPDTGLLGRVKAGFASFKAAVTAAFTRPPAPPAVTIPPRVNVTINNQASYLSKDQIEPMIMSLPKSARAAAAGTLATDLQTRITNGARIMAELRAGRPTQPATPQNVADFMLTMYALANMGNNEMTNGSFSVPDEDGAIANWLDTSSEVYVRSSSHLHAYQSMQVDGHLNLQRGIDVPEGVSTGLPNGHRTVLYGTIPGFPGNERNPPTGRRIFLKTESAGCRHNTAKASEIQQAVNTRVGMRIRDSRLSDVSEFFRHAFSFLATRGQQGSTTARKEHFPSNVSKAYKEVVSGLQQRAKAGSAGSAMVLDRLTAGGPAKGGGVCMLLRNLSDIEGMRGSFQGTQDEWDAIMSDVGKLRTAVANMPHPDNLDIRLGNEVLIHI